jgi:hypothetical protein
MLSQDRLFLLLLLKACWLTEVCLPFVVLKPLVRGGKKRKEERWVGERNSAQMAGAVYNCPWTHGGLETWE